jgi:dolichol-phosphate mannosyltransferase
MHLKTGTGRVTSKGVERGQAPDISVVVPLYNEEENVAELYRRLSDSLQALGLTYELVLVDDGSQDSTPQLMDDLEQKDGRVLPIHLSRNFGHQAAMGAGMDHAQGRAVILMDGDLQDPPEVLGRFIQLWQQGYEVVYAVRRNRKEGVIKRAGYFCFYRLLHAISDLDIPIDSGDFCLMDRKVVDVLVHLPERLRFLRGLRTFVGFRQIGLSYDRAERSAGKPKYTFRALLGLATDGLISFSSYPLHLASYLGLFSVFVAMLLGAWVVSDALLNKTAPRGWASMLVVMIFMGAIQLISLGIVGEYVRRIFIESKRRPTYIVANPTAYRQHQRTLSKLYSTPDASSSPSVADLSPSELQLTEENAVRLEATPSKEAPSSPEK